MADPLADSKLAESILKLATAMEKSNSKVVGILGKMNIIDKKDDKKDEKFQSTEGEPKKGEVLKRSTNVIIEGFSKRSLDQLSKLLRGLVPKEKISPKLQENKPDSIWRKLGSLLPLLLPIGAIILRLLSEDGISKFLSTIFPKLFNAEAIAKFITKSLIDVLKALRTSIKENFKSLKESKLLKGIMTDIEEALKPITESKVFKSVFGEEGILTKVFGKDGVFAKYFGESSEFGKLFGKDASELAKPVGKGLFAKVLGGVGKTVFKYLPIIGSAFNFYESYNDFNSGDYFGGIVNLFSGVANLFPGLGTIISIALDAVDFLFNYGRMKEVKELTNQGAFTQAFSKFGDVLVDKIPFLKWFYDISEDIGGAIAGDDQSLMNLFEKFGLKWLFDTSIDLGKSAIQGVLDIGNLLKESLYNPIEEFFITLRDELTDSLKKFLDAFNIGDYFKKLQNWWEDKKEDKPINKADIKTEEDLKKYRAQRAKELNSTERLNDFIKDGNKNYINKDGTHVKFSKDDTVIGMKDGGKLDKLFTNIGKELAALNKRTNQSIKLLEEQLKVMQADTTKIANNIVSSNVNHNNIVLAPSSSVASFRSTAIAS